MFSVCDDCEQFLFRCHFDETMTETFMTLKIQTSKKKNDLIKCRFLSPAISEAIPRVSASPSTALRR